MITFEEIKILEGFFVNYKKILDFAGKKEAGKNNSQPYKYKVDRGVNVVEIVESKYIVVNDDNRLLDNTLVRLNSYGLLDAKFGAMGGTYYGPITQFGLIFIDFIS
ncbi:MAG: hypothetical protein ACD_26C00064G0001 [uncultured bacterium]|nr:MAG: hypothetical protein ACD_26C00064G0001 [uncultured bacterium]